MRLVAPGAGGRDAHADAPGNARVRFGGVRSSLLVAHQHVANVGVVPERVVEGEDSAARYPEHDVDGLAQERLANDSCARHLHGGTVKK